MTFANKEAARAFIDAIPFREARWFARGRLMAPDFVVVHTMESSEHWLMAENWQAMTATQDRKSSVNFGVDDNSTRAAVHVTDTAYHVGYGNRNTVGVEHTGRALQTLADWADPFSDRMLRTQSAPLFAALAVLFDIPIRRATTEDYKASRPDLGGTGWNEGRRGILGHVDVARAIQQFGLPDSGHYDPGVSFPWDWYLDQVRSHIGEAMPITEDEMRKIARMTADEVHAKLTDPNVRFMGEVGQGDPQTIKAAVKQGVRETIKADHLRAN